MAEPDTFTLRVFRYDPEQDGAARYQDYTLPRLDGMTVLQALTRALEEQDHSLAFRYSCREAICGSCALYISGSYRLACRTQVKDALEGGVVTVSPLPHMQVLKDLVVDMAPFWRSYEQVKPYLIHDGDLPDREFRVSPAQRARYNELVDCILCGACFASCPAGFGAADHLGPHALVWAYRYFIDSRDTARDERLALVAGENGVFRCHTAFNCVAACPKHVNQAEAAQGFKAALLAKLLRIGPLVASGAPGGRR